MRDVNRIDGMLKVLGDVWKMYPDFRLGQLITICAEDTDIFGIEDDKMLENMIKFKDKLSKAMRKD